MTTQASDTPSLDDLINPESDSDFSASSLLMQDYRYDTSNKVIEFKSYRTVLSLPARLAAKKPSVRISADDTATLHIAGVDYTVGPDKWQTFSFDAAGELTMSVAAGAVHTPSLRLNLGGMAANEFLTYAPDTDLHEKLANLQAADLTSGANPILPADQHDHAEGIAASVRQIAALATSTVSSDGGAQAFGLFSKIKKGVSSATSTVTKSVSSAASTATSTVAKTATSAANTVANTTTSAANTVANTATSAANTVAHETVKIADTAYHDAAKGVDFVAKRGAIKDGFAAASGTLSFMAKEGGKIVKKAIDFAVTTRREAWELVHKVFQAIEIGVEKLIAALAQLFGWEDILDTKRAFEKTILYGMRGLKEGASSLSKKLSKKIEALRGKADKVFDDAIAKLGKQAVAGGKKISPSNGNAQTLWLHHKVKDHGKSMKVEKPADGNDGSTAESRNKVSTFITKLEAALVGKNASAEYSKSLALIKKELANPANLPEVAGQVLILCVRAVTDVALGLVDIIVTGLLELVVEIIEVFRILLVSKIHIPFISDFYKQIAGDDLRLIDLVCLVLASIVTPVYKLAHGGKAPYGKIAPLSNDVYSFDDTGDDAAAKRRSLNQELVAVIIGFSMIFEVWEDCEARGATDDAEEGEAIPSIFLMLIDILIQSLLVSGDGGPGDNYAAFLDNFSESADSALENAIWLFEWTPIAADIVSLGYSLSTGHGTQLMRSEGKWGPVVEFTIGIVMVLAAAGQLTERLVTKSTSSYQAGLEFGFDLAESVRHLGKLFLEASDDLDLGILIGIDIATCSTAAGVLPFISG